MSFDKCIHSCNHSNQGAEHFHRPVSFHAPFQAALTTSHPNITTVTISIQQLVLSILEIHINMISLFFLAQHVSESHPCCRTYQQFILIVKWYSILQISSTCLLICLLMDIWAISSFCEEQTLVHKFFADIFPFVLDRQYLEIKSWFTGLSAWLTF